MVNGLHYSRSEVRQNIMTVAAYGRGRCLLLGGQKAES